MQIKFRIVGGKNAGQEIAVVGPTFMIGKAATCQMRPRSDQIADEHCKLQLEPGLVRIVDLGSVVGTLVNGVRVQGSQELKPGDILKVGPLEFEVVLSASLAAKKKPKVSGVEDAAARMAGSSHDEIDVAQWLDSGDVPTPSRYAAKLSDDEKEALTSGSPRPEESKAVQAQKDSAASGVDETRDAAQDVLNKMMKRR